MSRAWGITVWITPWPQGGHPGPRQSPHVVPVHPGEQSCLSCGLRTGVRRLCCPVGGPHLCPHTTVILGLGTLARVAHAYGRRGSPLGLLSGARQQKTVASQPSTCWSPRTPGHSGSGLEGSHLFCLPAMPVTLLNSLYASSLTSFLWQVCEIGPCPLFIFQMGKQKLKGNKS